MGSWCHSVQPHCFAAEGLVASKPSLYRAVPGLPGRVDGLMWPASTLIELESPILSCQRQACSTSIRVDAASECSPVRNSLARRAVSEAKADTKSVMVHVLKSEYRFPHDSAVRKG